MQEYYHYTRRLRPHRGLNALVPLVLLAFALHIPSFLKAQTCEEIQSAKSRIYNFKPSTLSREKQQEKGQQIDTFWNLVKGGGTRARNCLRELLSLETSDGYFVVDGSNLLQSIDTSIAASVVVSRALSYADFNETEPFDVLHSLINIAQRGVDIGAATRNYLNAPRVDFYVPQHSMTVDRIEGTIFLVGSMTQQESDDFLAQIVHVIPDSASEALTVALAVSASEAATVALAVQMTERSYQLIDSLRHTSALTAHQEGMFKSWGEPIKNVTTSLKRTDVIAQLTALADGLPTFEGIAGRADLISAAVKTLTKDDLPLLRRARRVSVNHISDEALDEYQALTRILLAVIVKEHLYEQYRGK